MAHTWMPLKDLPIELDMAYTHTRAYGNSQPHAYVMLLDFSARMFGPGPIDVDDMAERYGELQADTPLPLKMLVHIGECARRLS